MDLEEQNRKKLLIYIEEFLVHDIDFQVFNKLEEFEVFVQTERNIYKVKQIFRILENEPTLGFASEDGVIKFSLRKQ